MTINMVDSCRTTRTFSITLTVYFYYIFPPYGLSLFLTPAVRSSEINTRTSSFSIHLFPSVRGRSPGSSSSISSCPLYRLLSLLFRSYPLLLHLSILTFAFLLIFFLSLALSMPSLSHILHCFVPHVPYHRSLASLIFSVMHATPVSFLTSSFCSFSPTNTSKIHLSFLISVLSSRSCSFFLSAHVSAP